MPDFGIFLVVIEVLSVVIMAALPRPHCHGGSRMRATTMKSLLIAPFILAGILGAASSSAVTAPKTSRTKARRRKPAPLPPVDPTEGDNVDGDDLVIRRAAVDALGPVKGSVVVVEPDTGRILTIVNQKLALQSGFIPCSTIKLVTSLAALTEHVVDRDTWIYTSRVARYNMKAAWHNRSGASQRRRHGTHDCVR